ncbi:MAG: MopE-related protein [archaeon]
MPGTPSAEVCGDGIDNDCDGTLDNGCAASGDMATLLHEHNTYRSEIPVSALVWDTNLTSLMASKYGSTCTLQHINPIPFGGENMALASSAEIALSLWYAEKQYYNPATGNCIDGNFNTCGHYINMIRAASTKIGCSKTECGSNDLWACGYEITAVCTPTTEVCDGADNDCDGTVDEGCSGNITCYVDADKDGYGTTTTIISTDGPCSTMQGESSNSNDCNDGNAAVHPWAAEVCDGIDNDCDGDVDESTGGASCTVSGKLGVCAKGAQVCASGQLTCIQTVFPTTEVCDGFDNDCDGTVDEGCALPADMTTLLTLHNTYRSEVGANPLVWDANITSLMTSKYYTNYCSIMHVPPFTSGGENMGLDYTTPEAWMTAMYAEKAVYDSSRGTCDDSGCGHYRNIIRSASTKIGCLRNGCNLWACGYE